jgi:hypothetical protein
MTDNYEDYRDDEEEEPSRDIKIDEAKIAITQIFNTEPSRVFYSVQIETRLERDFFHWITNKGLKELTDENNLTRITHDVPVNQRVNFYTHPRYRYPRRESANLVKTLTEIYDSEFTHAVGRHCEMLLDSAFARAGFILAASNANSWNGVQWTESNHNLDRIITKDSIAYGVEIKNTQNYISRKELRLKTRLCLQLGLRPLFVMRFAPKSYIEEVRKAGGFTLLFEDQIYPFGFNKLMIEVRTNLGLKVQCPRDFKDGDIQRFSNWHDKKLN